jgi:UDP-N-acetylglucosamine 2-epimerase (non-hydrolysing)
MKILSVFGTRPEALKMLPIILKLKECDIEAEVCVTAQHRRLLDQVLIPFGVQPEYDLNIMQAGQTLHDVTTRVLTGLAPILEKAQPDVLLVHGDTTTTFAAALAAFYAQVRVGHVEAGLRSYDKYRPFPEEINRCLTTQLADLHFAPTEISRDNLLREGVCQSKIFVTGNTAIDLVAHTTREGHIFAEPKLNNLSTTRRLVLMTAHRRENWGQPMRNICNAVKRLAQTHDITIVWPVHPGAAVSEPANEILGECENVILVPPMDIFDMHNLMRRAHLLLTDSGGIQEEAPSMNLPTIVLREVTERPEGLAAGTLILVGNDENRIYNETTRLLNNKDAYEKMATASNPFGDGNAAGRIIKAIQGALN